MCELISNLSGWFTLLGGGVFLFVVFDILYNVLNGIRIHYLTSAINLKEKFGDWAVVTGCTDGIGQAYAHELARRGINIVLVSRTLEKLKKTASEIESEHNIKTKIIAVDLSEGKSSIEAVKSQLREQKIGILVNNVGCATEYPKYLHECTEKELWDQLNLNICITTLMTRLILPEMKEKGKGAIVNLSSMTEVSPWPMFSVYAATKVFVKQFTEGLQAEYANSGITIQKLAPGLVSTKMTDFNKKAQESFISTDPITYSRNAVSTLGVTNSTSGYWKHGLQSYFVNRLPGFFLKPAGLALSKQSRRLYFAQEKLIDKED